MKRIKVKTANGFEFEVTGDNYSYDPRTKTHYLGPESYPSSIVVSVIFLILFLIQNSTKF